MPERETIGNQEPTPKKPKRGWQHIIGIALLGILTVMLIVNFGAIKSPFMRLLDITTPIIIGLVLAYILNFFLRFFEVKLFKRIKKRTVNRVISMILSYLLLLAILAGMLALILPQLIKSVESLGQNAKLWAAGVLNSISNLLDKLPFELPAETKAAITSLLDIDVLLDKLISFLESQLDGIIGGISGGNADALSNLNLGNTFATIWNVLRSSVGTLADIIVGIFISVYVLLSKERLNAGCRRVFRAIFSDAWEKRVLYYIGQAHRKIGGYLIGKMIDSTLVGLTCLILFLIFDIPFAVLIAVIIGVTDFIPFFGPFIGAIPSGIIIFIVDPPKVLLFALLILVVQQIDGNIIAPAILGDSTGLSSLGVIIAITVMGDIFGIPGMLIGVPIFALIMTILGDFIKSRLRAKGHDTDLKQYYPADAFIRPQDEKKDENTLTQKFVHWVRTVETEQEGVDYKPSRRHSIGRAIRRFFLTVGRFIHRLFSVKPIPEDRSGSIFSDIAQNGMRTNRLFWRTVGFSIITLGIYPFYLVEVIAQCTNIACRHDRRRTWGIVPYLLLSVVTLGIFPLIWHCKVISRMRNYCERKGTSCCITRRFYLCWAILGLPLLVGPAIALARFLRGFSQMCTTYNSTHTFPLSPENFKLEEQVLREPRPHRIPLMDQINEGIGEVNEEEETATDPTVDTEAPTSEN
ncbi:MAG: AI-2E family transporter [Ruminococcaceae bacterium]|nr:AI-2E family transporter [Oscillospiraceae bacterium]